MFDFKTLTYYGIAGALSLCLGLLLVTFSRFQPDTRSPKTSAAAILMMAVAYIVAAYGPSFPRWTIVLGTNLMLIGSAPILHSGFVAFCEDRDPRVDWRGWGIVAATVPLFWYWGLVEPDGNYRSAVFSFALAAITGRTAVALIKYARQHSGSVAVWTLSVLFSIVVMWMTARGFISAFSDPLAPSQRGGNPTTWVTVFAFIVMITLVTAVTMWMEISRLRESHDDLDVHGGSVLGAIGSLRNKLLLLWGTVIVLNIGIVSAVGVAYAVFHEGEKERLLRTVELTNDAFVEHTVQVIKRVDTVLHSVRSFHQGSRAQADTERFIASLKFDRDLIDNVYLINANAQIALSHDASALGRSVDDRAYFSFHRTNPADEIFISAVESGRVTGKFHFRITRRIFNQDGSFGGVLLATVAPPAFSDYYQTMLSGEGMLASLVGTIDHKIRARIPVLPDDRWQQVVESPIWTLLETGPSGRYESASAVDGVRRAFTYRKVPDMPLVMVTAYSAAELIDGVIDRVKWLAVGATFVLAGILSLAALLTVEIRRRDEQDRFMSMLNHEIKTPMSVIRMSMGDELVPSRIRERVMRAVFDMGAIVERSLLADRLQLGYIQLNRQICHVDSLMKSVAAGCSDPSRVSLTLGDLPSIYTDSQLLEVIVKNLIDNALKYSPSNAVITVSSSVLQRKRGHGISICVSNPPGNAGIPDVRKVFRKYYRAPGAHSKTGSGLGLYIASGFGNKIGGHLSYLSAPGEIKFELWIPI